jgi:hypothetical protein
MTGHGRGSEGEMTGQHRSWATPRRRILLTATLGAVLGLARTARRAVAVFGPMLLGQDNAASLRTTLLGLVADGPALHVQSAAGGSIAIAARGSLTTPGIGVVAQGGANSNNGGGTGAVAFGGASVAGSGATGLSVRGGASKTGEGGAGGEVFGLDSRDLLCGEGAIAIGGSSEAGSAGIGAHARGARADAEGQRGGTGLIATGGDAAAVNATPGPGVLARGGFPIQGTPHTVPGGPGVVAQGGAYGQTTSDDEAGVRGENMGKGPGVIGDGFQNGVGVFGQSLATAPDMPGGRFYGSERWGAIGLSVSGPGAQGVSTSEAGAAVRSSTGPGLLGTSVDGTGLTGSSDSSYGGYFETSAPAAWAGYADNANAGGGPSGNGAYALIVNGDWEVTNGDKSAAVPTSSGLRLLYAVEGPVAMLEDLGIARLVAGRARVELDPLFAETIELRDYHVFVSPRGQTAGVYVAGQDARGFELREQQGGASTFDVSYRVVARRKGLPPDHRLAPARSFAPPPSTPPKPPLLRPNPLAPVKIPVRPVRPADPVRPTRPTSRPS